jgi:hypothetical protein
MTRTSNKNAGALVDRLEPFRGNHTFATNEGHKYVVYSYGYHWILYIYDRDTCIWYENEDKYSATTSKHRSQLRPNANTVKISKSDIHAMV